MGNQSNMLCLYVKQDISKFIVSTSLEGFVRNTGRKRMAALIRKFQEKLLILIHNRCLGCQETEFLVLIFSNVKYSAGQMLHIVRDMVDF